MQFVRLKLVVPIAFLALGVSGTSRANEEVVRLPVHTGGLQGKIEYCTDCHGASGRGYRGDFRFHAWRASHQNISRISYALSSKSGA